MRDALNRLRPERFFLLAAVFFGICLTFLVPPLQSPDERNHFYKAYQVSEGRFFPEKTDQRLGGQMPYSFKVFSDPFMKAGGNEYYRVRPEFISGAFGLYVNDGVKEFEDFPNTAYYAPVSYLPHAVALFVLRQFNASVGTLYYGGRLIVFLFWLACMFFIIKMVPVYKWLLTALILLPMNIYISNSFSADVVTNILSFFFIALVLRYISGGSIGRKEAALFIFLVVMLALAKVIYVFLVFLLLAVPAARFRSPRRRWSILALICAAGFFTAVVWSGIIMKYYISYNEYNVEYRDLSSVSKGADYYLQKAYVMQNKAAFFKMAFNTMTTDPEFYLLSYIGGFGTYLHLFMPYWLATISYLFILFVALAEARRFSLTAWQKLVFFVTAVCTLLLLLLSQHLTWNIVGNHVIDFLQGRYLTPLFPLFFMLIGGRRFRLSLHPQVPVMVFACLVNVYALWFLYSAFIKDLSYATTEFYCGAEEAEGDQLRTSHPGIFLGGAQSRSSLEHRSGSYSARLSPESAYGFIYKFRGLDVRDLLEVEAWQKGEGAVLVFSGKGATSGEFYFPEKTSSYKDKNGWYKLHMLFSVWGNFPDAEVSFCIFNPSSSVVYVDDVTVRIKKFKDETRNLMPQ